MLVLAGYKIIFESLVFWPLHLINQRIPFPYLVQSIQKVTRTGIPKLPKVLKHSIKKMKLKVSTTIFLIAD